MRDEHGWSINEPPLKFTEQQLEFLDGVICGDGGVYLKNKNSACFCIGGKYKEFLDYVKNILNIDNKTCKYNYYDERLVDKNGIRYSVNKQNVFFVSIRKRWYRGKRKVIPKDFRFGKLFMLALYLGDGKLHKSDAIELCLECFSKSSKKRLIKKLKNIGVKCWINKRKRIYISSTSKNVFLEFIGSCPIKCYEYKWDKNIMSDEHKKETDKIRNRMPTKLSYDKAEEIRNKYSTSKYGILQLAKEYNVNDKSIRDVLKNKSWPDTNYDPTHNINLLAQRRYRSNINKCK